MQTTGQVKPTAQRPSGPATRRVKPAIPDEFKAEGIEKLDQPALIRILGEPGSEPKTVFRKAIACKRLAAIGSKEAAAPLAALLSDDRASDYARDALEAMPDPAASDALRAALPKLKGLMLVGVINSIRRKRDRMAVEPLGKLIYGADAAVAGAAAQAVGDISGPVAAKLLQRALVATKGTVRGQVAAGALLCADRMMAEDRKGAFALLDRISRPDIPSNVRVAAMHLQVVSEVSLQRPRTAPVAPGQK